jgi:polysaccharide biosynthesis transport protein
MNDVSLRRNGSPAPADGQRPSFVGGAPTGAEDASLLRYYLVVMRRRRWLIFGSTVIVLLAGLALTLMITPKYTASTTIEIQRDNYKITGVQGVEPETTPTDMEFYQTQYGLLRSQSLAQRVAADLRLGDEQSFFQMFGAAEGDEWFENGHLRAGAP